MTAGRVLVVDDDAAFRFAMRKALGRLGYDVTEAPSGEDALTLLAGEPPDAALLDLRMEGIDGIEVLRRRGACPTRFIVLTGHGTVQAAVEAMKLGAFSFLEKPVDADVLAPLLVQAVREARASGTTSEGAGGAETIIGPSDAMAEVRRFVVRVGHTDETVAVYGETGTGKEVVARALHAESTRASGPFVAVNAACVPRELFESELFGHRKGSFTGATGDRAGLFRDADGGTIFIDEVAELPSDSQAKLLRTLETRTVRAIGDTKEVPVDVRIIVATNRDLWAEVKAGRFREDLYFRLQVLPIVLPPLRARVADVVPLALHLLERIDGKRRTLADSARAALEAHDWPGNVRELLNVMRRVIIFAEREEIDGALVRRMVAASVFAQASVAEPVATPRLASSVPGAGATATSLADVERAHIEQVLQQMGGNITRTATALGIDRRTLQRKLRTYGISADDS